MYRLKNNECGLHLKSYKTQSISFIITTITTTTTTTNNNNNNNIPRQATAEV
jgi:hypothetical protein